MKHCPYDFKTGYNSLREECIKCSDSCKKEIQVRDSSEPAETIVVTLRIRQNMGEMVKNCLQIGRDLIYMKENNKYKLYASHIETWKDYCRELHISKSSAHNFMNLYEVFGKTIEKMNVQILDMDHSRLIRALPYTKTEEEAEQWVHNALHMDSDGFQNAIRQVKGLVPRDECDHEFETVYKCSICGYWKKENRK